MTSGTFKLELSGFSFVKGPTGRSLRLSVTWTFTDAATGAVIGAVTEGCLVTRKTDGDLVFNFPATSWGRGGNTRRLTTATPDLKKTIIAMINRSRFAAKIGAEIPVELMAEKPENVDPTLPATMVSDTLEKEG